METTQNIQLLFQLNAHVFLLLKSQDITICNFVFCFCPYMFQTRVGHLQGAQCQCLAKVIIDYNLLKLR
jgi:hypothetical protein